MEKSTDPKSASTSWRKLRSTLEGISDPQCELCGLHEQTTNVCIPINLPEKRPDYIIVGEAPGGNEESTGLLFSGPAGQLLWKELETHGFQRSQFAVTNSVKCRPQDNNTPTKPQIRTCSTAYLGKEIGELSPQFGLVLGNSGLYGVSGRTGITRNNAQTFEGLGVTWVAAFHPAAVLRNPRYMDPFRQALLVFKRLVRGEQGEVHTEAVCVNDRETLKALVSDLEGAKVGAIDVETWSNHPGSGRFPGGGLAWWDPSFRLASVNISVTPGKAYVIPLWHKESRWKDPQKVLDVLKPHLEAVPKWVMHNGQFDLKCLKVFGVNLHMSMDTMGAEYALDENAKKDLGLMSQVYLSAEPYKDTVDKRKMYEADLGDMVEYGAMDADYTLRLRPILIRRLKGDLLSKRLFTKLLMPAARVLTEVEYTGIPVHRGKFEKRWDQNRGEMDKALEVIQSVVPSNLRPFNPNSNPQLTNLLFNHLDFPVLEMTKGGKPSANESVLLRLRDLDDSGVIDALLDWRKWNGYNSRYFKSWAQLMDGSGRLHSHFKPFHTVTGRLSSESPNLQQVPRDTFIRGIIGGRRGWVFLEADYSQVELRIVAHLTQDSAMLRAFNSGEDIHLKTAMEVTGLSPEEITSEIRKKAKAVNFGFVYGMGYYKFQEYSRDNYGLEVTEGEAKEAREAFFRLYRGLAPWHDRQRKAAKRRKWVVTPMGRKRRLWDIDSTNKSVRAEAERQAINSPVQGMASDMTMLAMVMLHPQLKPDEARIVSTVHDALLFEIRQDKVDRYLPIIKHQMENLPLEDWDVKMTVPIKVDMKVGRFWSEGALEVEV